MNFLSGKAGLLLALFLTTLVYANTLNNKFVWDDQTFTVDWPQVRSLVNIPKFFAGAYPGEEANHYRPIKGIILTLDYKLFGGKPFFYHLQAIIIHLAATFLVYLIAKKLTGEGLVASLTGLFFGLHPIHVEAITFVTSSSDIVGIVFLLASFYYYLRRNLPVSLILALLAYLANEITLVLAPLIVLYELSLGRKFPPVKFYLPHLVVAASVLALRFFVLKIGGFAPYLGDSFWINLLLVPKLIVKYVGLLIWPVDLNVNHEILAGIFALRYVDLNPEAIGGLTIFNFSLIWPLLATCTLVIAAVVTFKKWPILAFCFGWFLISLAPVLNILPLKILFAERYAYLASFGYCLLLAVLIARLMAFGKVPAVFFLLLIGGFYGVLTFRRNLDWQDPVTLWAKTVSQVPESTYAHYNLGIAYQDMGEDAQALGELELAAKYNYLTFPKIGINLARAYIKAGDFKRGIDQLSKIVQRYPENFETQSALGDALRNMGQLAEAAKHYQASITVNSRFYESHIGLGIVYARTGEIEKAVEEFKMAKAINPYLILAYNNLASIYASEGKIDLARAELEAALVLDPQNALLQENLRRLGK